MATKSTKGPTFLRVVAPIVETLRELGNSRTSGVMADRGLPHAIHRVTCRCCTIRIAAAAFASGGCSRATPTAPLVDASTWESADRAAEPAAAKAVDASVPESADRAAERATAKARAEECEAAALRVVEALPEVMREEASLKDAIAKSDNPALRLGGFVGPGPDGVGFGGSLGIDGAERLEAHIFYGVDGAGTLTVNISGPDLTVSKKELRAVARACKGYDYWAHVPPSTSLPSTSP